MRRFVICLILVSCFLIGCGASESAIPETLPTEPVATVCPTEATQPSTEPATEPTELPVTEPPTEPVPEIVIPADPITEGIDIRLNDHPYAHRLTDDNIYSQLIFSGTTGPVISSETPFSSIYFKWDFVPNGYTVQWESGNIRAGAHGFLHEYIELPEPVTKVELVFDSEAEKRLCDVFLFTEGVAPAFVQLWEPPCAQADILVFPTHSDDETLFFGPLIAYYTLERELNVQTAFMVNHRYDLHRGHERLDALWALGMRLYPILGDAPDYAGTDLGETLYFYRYSPIFEWQVEQIRRFQPQVVVGHDINGEYGNGGHKVNTHYLIQAIEAAADPEQEPETAERYGVWDTPKFYLHLYKENQIILDVNTAISADPEQRSAFRIAEDAFEFHRSQMHLPYRVRQGSEWWVYDSTLFGLYRTLVGADTGNDMMEHILPRQ